MTHMEMSGNMKHLATISKEFVEKIAKTYWDDLSYFEQRHYIQTHPKTTKRITATPPVADKGQQMCPLCHTKFVDRDKTLAHIRDFHSFTDTTPETMEAYNSFKKVRDRAKKTKFAELLPPLSRPNEEIHDAIFKNYGRSARQQLQKLKEPVKYVFVGEGGEYVKNESKFYDNLVSKLKLTTVFDESSGDEPQSVIADISQGDKEQVITGKSGGEYIHMRIAMGNIDGSTVVVHDFERQGTTYVKPSNRPMPYTTSGIELFIGATDEENKTWEQRKQEKINRPPRKDRPLTEDRVRRLGRQIARELKSDDKYDDSAVYDVAENYLVTTPGLKDFFTNKGVKEQFMSAAFADYISL